MIDEYPKLSELVILSLKILMKNKKKYKKDSCCRDEKIEDNIICFRSINENTREDKYHLANIMEDVKIQEVVVNSHD